MGDPTDPAADEAAVAGAVLPITPAGPAIDRYTALVAALLGVRTDYASARFDAEVAAAIAANRLDVGAARTLRWWQRESVREVEGYAGRVLPAALATRSDAETTAALDSDESGASWQQAQTINPPPARSAAMAPAAPAQTTLPARVITIPDHSTRRRSASEIQQAVRAALRATAAPIDPGSPFEAPSRQDSSSAGRDRGDHAHSAPTA
jgi:hypothetical protein